MTTPSPSGIRNALGTDSDFVRDHTQVIAAVIAFANGDTQPAWEPRVFGAAADDLAEGPSWIIPDQTKRMLVAADERTARTYAEQRLHEERQYAVEVLDALVRDVSSLNEYLAKSTEVDSRRSTLNMAIVLRPVVRIDGEKLVIDWQIQSETDESYGWILFAAALVAENARDGMSDLARCQLESCGRFFLIERGVPGKPRTQYCQPAHRMRHHALRAAERQRTARAKKRSARKPK